MLYITDFLVGLNKLIHVLNPHTRVVLECVCTLLCDIKYGKDRGVIASFECLFHHVIEHRFREF